jgi:hypothetical protein
MHSYVLGAVLECDFRIRSFLVKMFELNIEAFHSYKNIVSILPCWSLF